MEPSQNIRLSEDSLSNLLLDLEEKESSVDLLIRSSIGDAAIYVRSGKLAEARFGDLHGLEAARALLSMREGRCAVGKAYATPKEDIGASLGELVKQLGGSAHSTGSAAPSSPGTLSMGSRISLTDGVTKPPKVDHKKTMQSRIPSQSRMPIVGELSESGSPNERRNWSDSSPAKNPFTSTVAGHPHKPVPARLMRQDKLGKSRTGYSSRPPPGLAEEHVPLPKSLRRVDALPKIEGLTTRSTAELGGSSPATTKGMSSTLGIATMIPDDGLSHPAVFVNDVSTELPPDSPSSGFPTEAAAPRLRQHSIYDEEIVDAAEGQLSDSEMPLPSTRLSMEALTQLRVLNEAVSSRRRSPSFTDELGHERPISSAPHDPSLELASRPSWDLPSAGLQQTIGTAMRSSVPPSPRGESVPAPTSSQQGYTGTQSFTQQPGSVPDPSALPGTDEDRRATGNLPRVGRYEVLSRLKRGGMGSVYMCRLSTSAGFRRLFAMKVLHGHLAQQSGAIDAFFHEARVLGGLHHRNVVGIADVGTPEQPYIVLEYVEGGSLAEIYRATRRAPREPRLIATVLLDALSGLSAAHQARDEHGRSLQLVHCDVTPHNLLVGIDGTCRLTDFGIARTGVIDPRNEVTQGKPGYLAPERILKRPSDHRSDIFSVGVVLYAGLTGVEPFAGSTSEETMRNVLQQPLAPPSLVGFRPSAAFDLICMKALARDPNERFQSAEEMLSQLRSVAEREGMLASSAEVAAWVSTALAPTLKARRVASMRGAESKNAPRRWATMPPPSVMPNNNDVNVSSEPPSSSQEKTGPLSHPTSRDFGDTQILNELGGQSRTRKMTSYILLTAALLAFIWVLLRPEFIAPYIRMAPNASSGPESIRQEQTPPKKTPAHLSPKSDDENAERIVIPDIARSPSDP
jgi:serine/threonine protein kinase